jgi:hypothetical protein
VSECLRHHRQWTRGIAGLLLFIGLFFGALVVAIPAKPGEELPKAMMGAFGLVWLVLGAHRWRKSGRESRRLEELLTKQGDLTRVTLVEMRRGAARKYALDLTDAKGTTLRLIAPTAAIAQEVAGLIQPRSS